MRFHPEYEYFFSWNFMLNVVGLYLLMIVGLSRYMKDKKEWSVKNFSRVYDVVQVLLCSYMTYGLAITPIQAVLATDWNNFDFTDFLIRTIGSPVHSAHVERMMIVHYFSKVLDFVDTFIILVKKDDRRLSFLHVYHHVSVFLVWGYLGKESMLSAESNGIGAAYNSFIHVLMYSHYLLTSFRINNPFKQALTQMQITQFYVLFAHACFCMWHSTHALAYLQLLYMIVMILLFTNFYRQTYAAQKADGVAKKVSQKVQ
eukprot:TRINITY_DN3386_c0_g1_i1.p1 TRINITY_DN3386_c0_g1~~TRINITY_DN3386_c0_g1_i1.p1  ORF type:complete len:258 (-),score=50.29 TRINITY_DN3386_c0_g1_i1:41-814(-)